MYLLGYDLGSSSVKAAIVDAQTGQTIGIASYPETEMKIIAEKTGWAEQSPDDWWKCVGMVTKKLLKQTAVDVKEIKAIGIAYQMHGLVLVDKDKQVLRPAIIWCDSRAVEIGQEAFESIGSEYCLSHYLNSPGNFTASKLKWVKENEPAIFEQVDKMMLPGDFIAMKMTDKIVTTVSGLSEGVLWDFKNHTLAKALLEDYGIPERLIPTVQDTFSPQGKLTEEAAAELDLPPGIPIAYRAGDQPNNALALSVFQPNEVAATGGTSGVVYGVVDNYLYDQQSRVNGFAHVNHQKNDKRVGILLCINGAGSQYAWIKQKMASENTSYADMEKMIADIPVGCDGLRILPFGNGAERMLNNKNTGAHFINVQFNRHTQGHFYRAALEGIAFSFVYGFEVMKHLGLHPKVIKVGNDNLFQSPVFSQTIANLMSCKIKVMDTTGAVGAAKGSGVGAGIYSSLATAFKENKIQALFEPAEKIGAYRAAYERWEQDVKRLLG
ncbi:MAG: FGGY family carbohydrate kinase [Bacteroidota bacterium]